MHTPDNLGEHSQDQPYSQLDVFARVAARLIATGRLPQSVTEETGAEQQRAIPLGDRALALLLDATYEPDFPPGLPPKLRQLLQDDESHIAPPPDALQD